jgi:F-type H+-transporting ATPase subunit epsilon
MASLQLEIVTPDQIVLSRQVEYVGAPGIEGEFGVLPEHVPFISGLAVGCLYYKADSKTRYVFVSGGFAEVSDNTVTVLAECAEEAEHIDFARAERAFNRATERIAHKGSDVSLPRAEFALRRATYRLSLKNRG